MELRELHLTETVAARPHGVSRRRILQGAAWATPAILIATASPAMGAVSTLAAGLISPFNVSGTRVFDATSRSIVLDATLTNSTSGANEVTDVTLRFEFDSALVDPSAVPAIVSGTGWSYVGTGTTSGGQVYYEFSFASDVPSGGTTSPLQVSLDLAGAGDYATTVGVTATGNTLDASNGVIQVSGSTTISLLQGSILVNGTFIAELTGNGGKPMHVEMPAVVYNGPYADGNGSQGGLGTDTIRATFTMANTLVIVSTTSPYPEITGLGAGWTVESVTLVGSDYVVVFASAGNIPVGGATQPLVFDITRATPPGGSAAYGDISVAVTGQSDNKTVAATYTSNNKVTI